MKYLLTRIIQSLRTEEVRFFKLFSSNYAQKGQQKRTIELFDLLRSKKYDEYSDRLITDMFESNNTNAYYRLKNRLFNNLEHSIITFHYDKDEEFIVLNKIRIATILLKRSCVPEAFSYLEEAEKIALKLQSYQLLSLIYGKLINLCSFNYEIDPLPFINKKKDVLDKQRTIFQNEELLASISYQMHRSNFSAKEEGIVQQLEVMMEELNLSHLDSYPASFRIKVHQLARNILLQKREFIILSKYLEDSLIQFEKENFFTKKFHEEKIILLVWLVNSLSRTRDVEKSIAFTKQLGVAISEFNNLYYDKYVWLYYQSETVIRILQNRSAEAISLLNELVGDGKYENILSFFSVYLNLALLHYYNGDVEKGLENVSRIILSADYRNISSILQLNIGVVELVLSIEAANYHYAEGRYKELRRKFRKELKTEAYQEEKQFLEILRDFISKPDAENRPRTRERIDNYIERFSDFEMGSNESLDYSIWLQSRINRKPYYEIMLEKYFDNGQEK